MKNFVSSNILLGCLIAFILGLLTLVPIVNLFVLDPGAGHVHLAGEPDRGHGRESLEAGESPNMAAMGWSALTGFIAGLVGAVVASGFHLIMLHIFPHYNLLGIRARPACPVRIQIYSDSGGLSNGGNSGLRICRPDVRQ